MNLKSLVLCSDEKIVRVLRRTLGDLDIDVELCNTPESALRKLSRQRFEAIIADCAELGAAEVLRSARNAPCNKQAIAVAIVAADAALRSVFQIGAHFVLFKPVSSERAKASFRAARALMKCERRRNVRVPVQIPVVIRNSQAGANIKVTTTDLSAGGMAVDIPKRSRPRGACQAVFTLPGTNKAIELSAEFAWEGNSSQAGLRFLNVSSEAAHQLREWLQRSSPDAEPDDPPIQCQLTDLSLGGCYLAISSPFPVSTRVTLLMRAADLELRVAGVVRVMHPDRGMGVEFTQTTAQHRQSLEKFLNVLTENRNLSPELLVEPEGLEREEDKIAQQSSERPDGTKDPLLELFHSHAAVSAESFLAELRQQRGLTAHASA